MSETIFKWSSYIMTCGSLVIGIWSLIVSYKGYFKAKKASAEAENANKEISRINECKRLAENWKYELSSLEAKGRGRADGLIQLLARISNCVLVSKQEKEEMKRLLGTITRNIDDVEEGLFYTKVHNDMNEAEGLIQEVIDSFLYPSK